MRRNDERWSVKPIAKGAAALSISAALSGEGEEATLQGDVFWVASVEPIVVQKGAQ